MSAPTSNRGEIVRDFGKFRDVLNLSRPRRGKTLGSDIADIVAAGIQSRTLDQQRSPDGSNLPANVGDYGKAKRSQGIPVGVALEAGGDMLSFEELRGFVATNADTLVMEYGLDEEHKLLAEYFTEGDPGRGQVPRPFYELDSTIEDAITERMNQAADESIVDMGGV